MKTRIAPSDEKKVFAFAEMKKEEMKLINGGDLVYIYVTDGRGTGSFQFFWV